MERYIGAAENETLVPRSGIEYQKGMLTGEVPAPPMAGFMGLTLIDAEEGRAVFEGAPTEDHRNPMGTTHGGWFGAILDSTLGCAVMSRLPA